MTSNTSPEENLRHKWKAQSPEPANRISSTAKWQKEHGVPHMYGADFDAQAMDVETRHKLLPKSQWEKVIERKVEWPNRWADGNIDGRRTEPMTTDDEDGVTEWSFKLIDRQRAPKHKLCEILTDSYEDIFRERQHRERLADMGIWWSLYTGDAAEKLMYWYGEGYPLQAMTYLAVSRLKSNRALIPGRESEMISNFIWARKENPDELLQALRPDRRSMAKRAKTQSEEDSSFIYGNEDKESELGRRRAGISSSRKTRLTRLPIGATVRLQKPLYKLYAERTCMRGGEWDPNKKARDAAGEEARRNDPLAGSRKPSSEKAVAKVVAPYLGPKGFRFGFSYR